MKKIARLFAPFALLAALGLASCASTPSRRVSPPSASIQQLEVRTDGSWAIDLRIDNFSNVSMRFDSVDLALGFEGQPPATLRASPALSIGPESADVVSIAIAAPPAGARLAIADALAGRHRIGYHLEGTIAATPEGKSQRSFDFKRDNALSPVPGLPGVLR